jgi:signal transduction histidine kinase
LDINYFKVIVFLGEIISMKTEVKMYLNKLKNAVTIYMMKPWIIAKRGLSLFQPKSKASSEYQTWREQFLRKRLGLCFWLSFPCLLTYTIYDLFEAEFNWNRWVEANFARIFFSVIWAFLFIKLSKSYSKWIMLGFSWSITMLPNILMIYKNLPAPSEVPLNMVFISQTTLIPVYWRIHLTSQVGAIISHLISRYLEGNVDWRPGFSLIYWFWMSFICTVAVYLYERLQRQEFESRRELNVFLHSVSHDLRSPIMGTSIVLQNLLRKAQTTDNRVTVDSLILERLLQGSDRQLGMINSLLEAQNTSVKGITLNLQPCCLDKLVRGIVLDLKPSLDKNRIIVCNQISSTLPLVDGDPTQLWRVFNNLITNALKHNPPGIELALNAVVEVNTISISVADNGIGITPEHQERLFELYTRGDRARYMPGLGIGLYLCRQIITAHGGEIGVKSRLDRGSTFWFTLPIKRSSFK